MKLLLMIITCLFLTANIYASQTKDASNSSVQSEASRSPEVSKAPEAPGWAGANAEPPFRDDEGLQPSYSDTDEPSFGPDRDDE